MTAVIHLRPDVVIVKTANTGVVRYIIERHREPTIFPASLTMDLMYDFNEGLG